MPVAGERVDDMHRLVIEILLALPLQSSWSHCNSLGKMTDQVRSDRVYFPLAFVRPVWHSPEYDKPVGILARKTNGYTELQRTPYEDWVCACEHSGPESGLTARRPPPGGVSADLSR